MHIWDETCRAVTDYCRRMSIDVDTELLKPFSCF
jgi:hypothetical protein